jgi:Uma2 family endonuclease
MAKRALRRATYQDVLDAPPHMIAELIGGELHLQPRPGLSHSVAASALGEELGPPFKRGRGGPGGWILLDEPELHLGGDILVPDLGGWRRERVSAVSADAAYMEVAPDWACEVLSAGTVKRDRTFKMDVYHRERVPWLWFVDPAARTLEIFAHVERGWNLVGTWADDARIRAQPFDAIELDLSVLWADVARPDAG